MTTAHGDERAKVIDARVLAAIAPSMTPRERVQALAELRALLVVRAGVGWDEVQTIEERLEAVRNRVDARAAEATGAERREREFGRVPRRLAH